MRGWLVALAVVATTALSVGLPASPAAATGPTTTSTVVSDQATNLGWAGTEVTGATAYDTAIVTGDGTQPPAGFVTYSFFDNGTCTTNTNTTTDTEPVTAGTAQNSSPSGPPGRWDVLLRRRVRRRRLQRPIGPQLLRDVLRRNGHPLGQSDRPQLKRSAVTGGQTGADAGASSTVTGVSGFTPHRFGDLLVLRQRHVHGRQRDDQQTWRR